MRKNHQRERHAVPILLGIGVLFLSALCATAQNVELAAITKENRLQEQSNSIADNEAAAIANIKMIHATEATFQATQGNGRFGSFEELASTNLLDPKLLQRHRAGSLISWDGYLFQLSMKPSRRSFVVVARPIKYGVTGRRSFSIDEFGVLSFSGQRNATAAEMRPLIDEGGGIAANEASAIAMLRTIYTAEVTYQATAGNGDFGSLTALSTEGLIAAVPVGGRKNGYLFKIARVEKGASESRPAFEVTAIPARYGETGFRSFYIDESGTIRGADRKGLAANAHDEPVSQ
jgi:hypothetical protein